MTMDYKDNLTLTKRVQTEALKIIKVFQDICSRHNLRYFAIGGTCLGAVRHKGFIPWDDDVDVAMPYEDWLKFREIAGTELPAPYAVFDYNSVRHCRFDYYFKIHNENTTLVQHYELKCEDRFRGMFIDVFPVHGFPDNEAEGKKLLTKLYLYKKLNSKLRFVDKFAPSSKIKAILRPFILFCLKILNLKSYDVFINMRQNLLKKYKFGSTGKIIFPWRKETPSPEGWYKNIFAYEDFNETIELPFEDITIKVPAGYDRYLTMEFGDYMTLPPEKQRHNHLTGEGVIVDFDRSYKYYAELDKEAPKC